MSTPTSSTVLKAFQVLALFGERPLLGAGEASRLLGVPRASAHRLLVTLKAAGAVEANKDGQYRLSMRMFELGSQVPLRRRFQNEVILPLQQLAAATRLPVQLGVADGDDILVLERLGYLENNQVPVGDRAPLHATAAGKLLLANMDTAARRAYLCRPLRRFTANTLTDPVHLEKELRSIRHRGLAYGRQERRLGFFSLARGVRDRNGAVVAAIAFVVRQGLEDRLPELSLPLERTALAIEQRLDPSTGYDHAPVPPTAAAV